MGHRLGSALACAALVFATTSTTPAQERSEEIVRQFPFLDDESCAGSRSVGDTSCGYLIGSGRLEENERIGILPKQRERGLRHGTDELLAAIDDASLALYRATRTKLWVGNIARRGGGDIPWSVSHNSGRDADIAFGYQDLLGRAADPPDLVPLNSAGVSAQYGLRFDVGRTWLVVKALLESPHAQVQYLFISAPLKNLLLVHAKRIAEPDALVLKAAEVLRQPGGSGAHDDHLHVRVYCSERDTLAGCKDAGVEHSWHRGFDDAKRRRIGELREFLGSADASVRRRATDRLVLLDAREALDAVAAGLADVDDSVRRAAVNAIGAFGAESHVDRLAALWSTEPEFLVRIALLEAATKLGGAASGTLLARAVGVPERLPSELDRAVAAWRELASPPAAAIAPHLFPWAFPHREVTSLEALFFPALVAHDDWLGPLAAEAHLATALQLAAIDAAARSERLEPAGALANLLNAEDADVRFAADRALAFTTNQPPLWSGAAASVRPPSTACSRWRQLLAKNAAAPRDAWLVSGFRGAGFDIAAIHPRYAWELVRATASSDHLSFNAQRALMRLFDHRPPSLAWSKKDACSHWLRWLEGNRTSQRLAAPNPALRVTCSNALE